jgi:hypothetical protein
MIFCHNMRDNEFFSITNCFGAAVFAGVWVLDACVEIKSPEKQVPGQAHLVLRLGRPTQYRISAAWPPCGGSPSPVVSSVALFLFDVSRK